MRKLEADEIEGLCRDYPGWEFAGGELVRTFSCGDFVAAIAFVNRLAGLAEELGHHPDIDIRYSKVRLALVTHDAGGISTRDLDFIAALSEW